MNCLLQTDISNYSPLASRAACVICKDILHSPRLIQTHRAYSIFKEHAIIAFNKNLSCTDLNYS